MAFFQRPTDYPCQLILDPQNDYETLRRRVEQTTLKAQTVNRNRSGVTNVSVNFFFFHTLYLGETRLDQLMRDEMTSPHLPLELEGDDLLISFLAMSTLTPC